MKKNLIKNDGYRSEGRIPTCPPSNIQQKYKQEIYQ